MISYQIRPVILAHVDQWKINEIINMDVMAIKNVNKIVQNIKDILIGIFSSVCDRRL